MNSFSIICFNKQQDILINDLEKDYKQYIPSLPSIRTDHAYKSMLFIPLRTESQLIGIITVQSTMAQAYTDQAKNIIKTLAAYLSIALDNSKAYGEIKEKNQLITDSIRYAKRIQQSIVPAEQTLQAKFKEVFVIFYPKDIVSGDFYWYAEYQNKKIIAAIDCTGHGVPGGFMSMTGNTLLNEIVNQKHITSPAEILENLNQGVMSAFRQDGKSNDDGMDVCLCSIELLEQGGAKVLFSGAKRPLYVIENNELKTVQGDRKAIGGLQKPGKVFTDKEIELAPGAQLFLTTDGYVDQNGGEANKKFGTTRFLEIISDATNGSITAKKQVLEDAFAAHKDDREQRDDVTVIGIEV